jgi:hypothetical protein
MFFIEHCFICRPSDSILSEDAGIEPRTVATSALAVRRTKHSATYHPLGCILYGTFFRLILTKLYDGLAGAQVPEGGDG